jgi:hypothetical protein
MRFALRNHLSAIAFVAAASALFAQPALADSAFVTQASKGTFLGRSLISSPLSGPSQFPLVPPRGATAAITQPTPETTAAATSGNFARTLEMGNNNFVLQAQAGAGNVSNVGILGGMHDNVDVLQHGQGLVSNVLLAGVKGLTVDVIQPPGTAPVNMLIARLPNGMLDVIQPKGAPPATVIPVPGGLLVVRR